MFILRAARGPKIRDDRRNNSIPMNVVIAGGGTGGHLYPGIAIARELLKVSGSQVIFVGTTRGIEARVLPKEGLTVRYIAVGKLKGMNLLSIIRTVMLMPISVIQSLRILRDTGPDVVIGVGGYASGPMGLAALGLRIPLIIVEPNSYAGLANRKLGKWANKVVLCFPGTGAQKFFPPEKTVNLGPLVRTGIEQGDRSKALAGFGLEPDRYTVFVMGGSGGAHAINMAMKGAAGNLKNVLGLQVLHQTGDKDLDEVAAGYRDAGVKAVVQPYIHDMTGAYAAADLVIGRSGATTVAELAVCGKPAVLIPFPFAADNHQEYNAITLAERGMADVIIQRDLTPETLASVITKYRDAGARAMRTAPMQNTAAAEIARICRDYVQKN
jgi:UDP-N-acetylglucosamine--N-acetylmuramyl-(pentapeptide) pyrophosphoryl-undecaprenol N-acetylglucosamine transferase